MENLRGERGVQRNREGEEAREQENAGSRKEGGQGRGEEGLE